MDLQCCLGHVTSHQVFKRRQGSLHTGIDRLSLFERGFFQYPVNHLRLHARVANAQSQTPVLIAAQLGVNVSEPIVARMGAPQFQFGLSWGDIQFVVHHQDLLGGNFKKFGQRCNRLPGEVHEGLWLKEPQGLVLPLNFGHQSFVVFFIMQGGFELGAQEIDPPKPRVVASCTVLGSWVT